MYSAAASKDNPPPTLLSTVFLLAGGVRLMVSGLCLETLCWGGSRDRSDGAGSSEAVGGGLQNLVSLLGNRLNTGAGSTATTKYQINN